MNLNNNKDIHILGAGPAGMAVAHYANKKKVSFSLLERSETVGGNAKTIKRGKFLFDTGAHRFHDKNNRITLEMNEIMGDSLDKVYSPSKIFWNNSFIDFPISISSILKNVNLKTNLKIILENLLIITRRNNESHNFRDFAYNSYGKTISDLFLINYSEKLWGEDANNLSVNISGGRLNNLDLKSMIKSSFLRGKGRYQHLDGSFFYPKYGFGSIFTSIYKRLSSEDIFFKSDISKVVVKNNRVHSIVVNNRYELPVNNVVSTLPLPMLINKLESDKGKGPKLIDHIRYRGIKLLVIFLNKRSFSSNASLYFPSKNLPFTRIYEPKNRSKYMAPEGQTSIVVEIPYNQDNDNMIDNDSKLIDTIKSFLINNKFITDNDIIAHEILDMPYAYPILDINTPMIVNEAFNYLRDIENLYLIGRSSEFKYLHVHDLFSKSEKIVDNIRN